MYQLEKNTLKPRQARPERVPHLVTWPLVLAAIACTHCGVGEGIAPGDGDSDARIKGEETARPDERPVGRTPLDLNDDADVAGSPRDAAMPSAPTDAARAGYGVNLDRNRDTSTAKIWADVSNSFRRWGAPDKPWEANPNLKLSADGYPLSDAGALSFLADYPSGTYKLSYRGTATVTVDGKGTLAGPVVKDGDVSAVDVKIDQPGAALFQLKVTGIDPNDPIRDLRMMAPGTDADQVFTDEFLRRLRPFSTLRFMDWMETNDSPIVEWSDRTRPESFLQTGPAGVAYEYLIELANTLHKDIWINVPDRASDDYVGRLAGLLRDGLDPGIHVYLEYSNELWNLSFPQAKRNVVAAKANRSLSSPDDPGRSGQQAAFRLAAISKIFRREFGDRAGRVRPVLGGWAANPHFLSEGLSFLARHHGDPKNLLYGVAIAPYFRMDPKVDVPGLTLDGVFASMDSFLKDFVTGWISSNAELAGRYGLPMLSYEGGQHLVAWNPLTRGEINEPLKRAAQDDPRMGRLLRRLQAIWSEAGGGLFMHFTFIAPYTKSGYWGLLEGQSSPGSVKWDAVMGMLLPGGDSTLDGRVDFDDFLVLKGNFGADGTWWEQGDFTHDRRVDTADFAILRDHLAPRTPEQEDAVRAFAEQVGF